MNWLLVRGLARDGRHWHDFPRLLAERDGNARVELVDLPGAGTQAQRVPRPSVGWMARDLAGRLPDAASASSSRAWCLIGVSLGGMVALELCRLMPERFSHAVIVNASSRLTAPLARLRPKAALELARAAFTPDPTRRERRVLALTSSLAPSERARYARLSAQFAREAPVARRTLLAQLLAAARFEPPVPATITGRLLFVASRNDAVVNPRCSRDLAAAYASALEEHPGAGHDLALDDPDWLCERAVTFANGTHTR